MGSNRKLIEYSSICADLKGFIATKMDNDGLAEKLSNMGCEGWEIDRTLFTQDGGSTISAVIVLKREQGSTKKYEYSVSSIDLKGIIARKRVDNEEFNKTLNSKSQEGWELDETIFTQAFGATMTMFAIFRRELD